MLLINGNPYAPGTPFTNSQGIQRPANWERTSEGFTEVPDPAQQDSRYYFNNSDGTSVVTNGTRYINECFEHEDTTRELIDTSSSLDDLLSIDLVSGFPSRNIG